MSAFLDDDNELEISSESEGANASAISDETPDTSDLSHYKPRSSGTGFHINAPTWSMVIGIIAILGIIAVCGFAFFFDNRKINASRADAYVVPTVSIETPTESTTETSES